MSTLILSHAHTYATILGKNGTGHKGTNEKVGKIGTLMLNFPKLKPSALKLQTQTPIPNTQP